MVNISKQTTFTTTTQNDFRIDISSGIIFDNYKFKLQLEKGDTATPYTPPAAPVKYYLEHDYEPLTIDGFINYDNKIFSDFKTLKENIK